MSLMKKELYKNNYVVIDNFIDAKRAAKLYKELKKAVEERPFEFMDCNIAQGSQTIMDDRAFLILLVEKIQFMSEMMGEVMLPTYVAARLCKEKMSLDKHKDRHACEISVTLHLGSDGTSWPIYFTTPEGKVVSKNLKPGQAVIYLGCESKHWRNKFKGQEYGQVFLHYVRSTGNNWIYYFDRRVEN
jgi:hypothetical protein